MTINYRLGALGWLANPALDDVGIAGNYGLMDQQLAFKWVRDNIEHFGGNPNRVTIGGESVGGLSTSSNLASPTAKGLFHAGIIESGAYMLFSVQPVAAQEALGVAFATAVGCTGMYPQIAACLRSAPVATLLAAQGTINTSPTAGTTILPQGLADAFGSGNFNRVPIMQGTNLNEGTLFEPFFFDPTFTFVPGGAAQSLSIRCPQQSSANTSTTRRQASPEWPLSPLMSGSATVANYDRHEGLTNRGPTVDL